MSGLTLNITSMGNAAFEEPLSETARILRAVAVKVENCETGGVLYDVNGNKVGTWSMDLPETEPDE